MRRIGIAAIVGGLAVGLIVVVLRLATGNELTDYGSTVPWGLWVSMYIFVSVFSVGCFSLATLAYVFHVQRVERLGRLALITAFASLIGGLILIGLDLGHQLRFWRVFMNGSPSSWMIWSYTAYGIMVVAMLLHAFRPKLVTRGLPLHRAPLPAAVGPSLGGDSPIETNPSNGDSENPTTRRSFLAGGALLGGGLLASQAALGDRLFSEDAAARGSVPYNLPSPENTLYTVCQQCNTQCGIKAIIQNGTIVKIDGNPYSPWTMRPHLSSGTSLKEAASVDGSICPKGHAGIQTVYDPYRIRKVLKRDGPRGSGKWKTIAFHQAVEEIVEGGRIFSDIGEKRKVEGLRKLYAFKDSGASKEMAADLKKLSKGEITVPDFTTKYEQHMSSFIDPKHPDIGVKNNQFAFVWGRMKDGRGDLVKRFTTESFGSANAIGHTTVCQGSLYFSGKAMSEKFSEGDWDLGDKFYWQAELGGAEFVIFVGASPLEANYGPPYRSSNVSEGIVDGRLKIAVVDPRFSKTAAKAWKWVPAKPGTEGALAQGMIRWIFEHDRFNTWFLQNCNLAAATGSGEASWSNAAWLVKTDGKFLRGSDLGRTPETRNSELNPGKTWDFDPFVALDSGGNPVTLDPNDKKNAVKGQLLVDQEVGGIPVKSALQVIKESAWEHTVPEWARICGVAPKDLKDLAREFTSHGTKAAADIHRGVSQHTNGFYNVVSWFTLNALIGNYDHKGGMAKIATYNITGDKDQKPIAGKPFIMKDLHPAKQTAVGMQIIRSGVKYDHSTLFKKFPAKRPWFPLSSDVYQEVWPSIADGYPYPLKALILYMGSPAYSLPAGHKVIETLKDPEKLPLFVASDIVVGETSMYADYIFPDLSNLERWEFAGSHPSITVKSQPIRQPVIAPIPEIVNVAGEMMPISLEAMILAIADRLKLPGFGSNGFGPGRDLLRGEDLYMLLAANVAAGDAVGQEVPDISPEELQLFLETRRYIPATAFDPSRWEAGLGSKWWKKVAYVLSRGGRFASPGSDYKGEMLANTYGKQINIYMEKTGDLTDSMTGKKLSPVGRFNPSSRDSLGRKVDDERKGYPLRMITFREMSQTKSRTSGNYWLQTLLPKNKVLINKSDADRLGFRDGDEVTIVSATNPDGKWDLQNGHKKSIRGELKVMQGIRPGVIAFSLGHGHWAYGSTDIEIDGKTISGDKRRGKGFHANAAMRVDPHLKDVCLQDLAGGSAVFYDTNVKLKK